MMAPDQFNSISTTDNTNTAGLAANPQHGLREAQQHSQQASPGPAGHHPASFTNLTNSFSHDSFMTDNAWNLNNAQAFLNNAQLDSFQPELAQWQDVSGRPRTPRRVSNGIADQVLKFEQLGKQNDQPGSQTPNQEQIAYFPPTPTETPHGRVSKHQPRPDRFSEGHDESMEATIKPSRKRRSPPGLAIFPDMNQLSGALSAGPSPPNSSTIPQDETFPSPRGSMDASFSLYMPNHFFADAIPEGQEVPATPQHGRMQSSVNSTPISARTTPYSHHTPHTPLRIKQEPTHEGYQSDASAKAKSFIKNEGSPCPEAKKLDTGVTEDDIGKYIVGPDSNTGKWECCYKDCGKTFGRKENIKSHVQTHLNDRQFQCDECNKCFVRSHDLKRHKKIHSSSKPYVCPCGNDFARHDALTRHRQRGMCIGAFDGVVRRQAKRGRPRKNPDEATSDRRTRKARARQNNMSVSSVSSVSSFTDNSAATSPASAPTPEGNTLFENMIDISGGNPHYDNSATSSAPMPGICSQPASEAGRSASQVSAASTPTSYVSHVSPAALMETPLMHAASSQNSVQDHFTPGSHLQTPPPEPRSSMEPVQTMPSLDSITFVDGLPSMSDGSSPDSLTGFDEFLGTFESSEATEFLDFSNQGPEEGLEKYAMEEYFLNDLGSQATGSTDSAIDHEMFDFSAC